MLTDTVNRWLTLSANVGVIAGLILVAVQIDQNTRIMKAQIVNDYYLGWHLGNEVGRRWWANYKDGSSDEFIQMVDEALARGDHKGNRQLLDSIMPAATDDTN